VVYQSDIAAMWLPEGPGLSNPRWPSGSSPASKTGRGVMTYRPMAGFDRPP